MEASETGFLVTWGSIGAAVVAIVWSIFRGLVTRSLTDIEDKFKKIDARLEDIESILQRHDTHLAVLQREAEQLMLSREKLEAAVDSIKDMIRRELAKASIQISGGLHQIKEEIASIKDLEDDVTKPR